MTCPQCQTHNPESAKFCLNCGTPLETSPPVKGERRLVTVLFADVVGSTSMAEHLDPEIVTEIMNGAFTVLNDAVARHEGTVARLMGDAIMAFFGAPIAHENDAERAIRAGLDIRDAAQAYGESIRRTYGFDFNIRTGINTGLVVLATVGDQIRSEYTVMGDTVNVASRLQAAAEPGTVLISGETFRLARQLFDVEPRGAVHLKGKTAPVETFEVLAARAKPGPERGLEGITSQLVGREEELILLRSMLSEIATGRGGLIPIAGEAGLGKSRLVAELRKLMSTGSEPQIQWIEGRALSYGQGAYYIWRESLLHAIEANPADQPDAVRDKLEAEIQRLNLSADDVPFLEAVLAVESEATVQTIANLDGDELPRRIENAIRHFLQRLAAQRPLVLVFDDLHWADAASMNLLSALSDLIETEPLLIIPVMRPEKETPSWEFLQRARAQGGDRFREVKLEPLDTEYSGELLANLLYIEDLPESIHELILQKAEGNPFFLEEIIRELIDSGYIVRQNGHWRATREIVEFSVPDTLVGVLSSRIDRLPIDTKRVAQHASIIGRIFNYPVLKAVCAAAPPDERVVEPLPHLARLTYEELVRERTYDPELEYIFKHVLTQEAAYNLLLVRTRREYHRRAGQVLESMYPDRLDELAATLAYHFWHGEDWLPAAEYSLRAGTRAERQLHALEEAYEHYEQAYQAIERVADAPAETYLDVVLAGISIAVKRLTREESLQRLTKAEQIARRHNDKLRLSQILHWIAHVQFVSGFSSQAMPALLENSELAVELGDERLRVYPAWLMAVALVDSNPRGALDQLLEVAAMASRHRNREIEAHTLAIIGMTYARLGEVTQAQDYIQRAFDRVRDLDAPVTVGDVYLLASAAYFDMGDLERGLEYGEIGTRKEIEARAMECASAGYCLVGIGNLQLSKPAEALAALQESLNVLDAIELEERVFTTGMQLLNNQVLAGMAIARYRNGDEDALEEMKISLRSSRVIGDDYTAAMVSQALAEAYIDHGEPGFAQEYLDEALAYYRRNEMKPYLIGAFGTQARLFELQGQTYEAMALQSEIQQLSDLIQAMMASAVVEPDPGTQPERVT